MLQRAASNAYSWWWASHVRTKQSKWLEQNLQDMGEKVAAVLTLIQEDGDSFIKKADMYYKKRPEFISFVEESYRAYRSLAERYDLLSKELQNANSTLASAFPDQYQYPMDDDSDEEFSSPKPKPKRFDKLPSPKMESIPKAPPPKFPSSNIKAILALAGKTNAPPQKGGPRPGPKSGLTRFQALQEVDKLQKTILVLQTEKEFARSTYESGKAKCCKIEDDITGMQEKISKLQDEYEINQVIEDEEARALMAGAALRSCDETLTQLQEKQKRATFDTKAERKKVKDARDKVRSLKGEFHDTDDGDCLSEEGDNVGSFDDDGETSTDPREFDMLRDQMKEHGDMGANSSLNVQEMAEKIDELVNKAIELDSSVSSQTALIQSLRSETDDLQAQVKSLEDDKANLIEGRTNLSGMLEEMENKLKGLEELNHNLENRNNSLETDLTEAQSNMEKLHDLKSDHNAEDSSLEQIMGIEKEATQDRKEDDTTTSIISPEGNKEEELDQNALSSPKGSEPSTPGSPPRDELVSTIQEHDQNALSSPKGSEPSTHGSPPRDELVSTIQEHDQNALSSPKGSEPSTPGSPPIDELVSTIQEHDKNALSLGESEEHIIIKEGGEPDWEKLFRNGLEGKEKTLLLEYTNTLRNYKELKKQLNELERKTEDDISYIEAQNQELMSSITMKDAEIQSLRLKLSSLQNILDEYKEGRDVVLPTIKEDPSVPDDDFDGLHIVAPERREVSPVEEKLRADIDEILENNLDFWMRFSGTFGQIQKFQTGIRDLQAELAKIDKENEEQEESSSSHGSNHHKNRKLQQSDVKPIYKHLKEIQTELTVWLEQSKKLKDESQRRFSQLCNIQEEIKRALNAGAETDDMKFTSFQAAKFQGEVANMQQENHRVADELQAGMDHMNSLYLEVKRTISRIDEGLGISGSKSQRENQIAAVRGNAVPLRSFIFGVKPQKKKQSIFAGMQNMHRKHHNLKSDKSF